MSNAIFIRESSFNDFCSLIWNLCKLLVFKYKQTPIITKFQRKKDMIVILLNDFSPIFNMLK